MPDTAPAVSPAHDPVTAPAHYTVYPVQPKNIYRHLSFPLGNAVKYVLRAPHKDGVLDLNKALEYLEWERVTPSPPLTMHAYAALDEPLEELILHLQGKDSYLTSLQAAFLKALDEYLIRRDPSYLTAMRRYVLSIRHDLGLQETEKDVA